MFFVSNFTVYKSYGLVGFSEKPCDFFILIVFSEFSYNIDSFGFFGNFFTVVYIEE